MNASESDEAAHDAPRADLSRDAGEGDAEQSSSSSHEHSLDHISQAGRLLLDQHTRHDNPIQRSASLDVLRNTGVDVSDDADGSDEAWMLRHRVLQQSIQTPATQSQHSAPRDDYALQQQSADSSLHFVRVGPIDLSTPNGFPQVTAYRRDDDEESADSRGAGTSTALHAPVPTGRRDFTMDELRDLQGFSSAGDSTTGTSTEPHGSEAAAKQIGNAIPPTAAKALATAIRSGWPYPHEKPSEHIPAPPEGPSQEDWPVRRHLDPRNLLIPEEALELQGLPRGQEKRAGSSGTPYTVGDLPMEELAKHLNSVTANAHSRETSISPSLLDRTCKDDESFMQTTPVQLSELREVLGIQETSADLGHQPAKRSEDDEAGVSSSQPLEQTLPSGREDDKEGAVDSPAEGAAYISDTTLGQSFVGEATETIIAPTANPSTVQHEAALDDASDSDGAESVFSQASLASTATTASLGGILTSTGDLITSLTFELLCTDEMNAINITALKDPGIGSERYRRNVRRLIKTFGRDLRAEAKDAMELTAARALQTRHVSTHAARELLTRSEALLGKQDDVIDPGVGMPANHKNGHEHADEDGALSDASIDSADEEEVVEQPTDENFTHIHDFLVTSKAYAALQDRMFRFAHQPYHLRITKAVGDEAISESGKILSSQALEIVVEELSWIPISLFTFVDSLHLPIGDRLKGFVEDRMHGEGDWRPLSPRVHSLRQGYCRLKWQSPCGTSNHLDVPRKAKKALQAAFASGPAFLEPAPAPSARIMAQLNDWSRPLESERASRASRSRSSLDMLMSKLISPPRIVHSSVTLSSSINQALNGSSPAVTPAGTDTTSSGLSMSVQNGLQSRDSVRRLSQHDIDPANPLLAKDTTLHLYLCIELDPLRFKAIRCDTLSDDPEFFAALKSAYDQTRGALRRWFSIWQYHRCEFYLFHKTTDKLGSLVKVGLPEDNDTNYTFEPRPPRHLPPLGPVTQGDFWNYYYHCNRRSFWEFWAPRPKSEDDETGKPRKDDALRSLPKWTGALGTGEGDEFFGLLAKEKFCYRRMGVYILILIAPCVVFCVQWLWVHSSDLQNAVVPLALCLAAIPSLVSWMKQE